jgi:hypothetical protein
MQLAAETMRILLQGHRAGALSIASDILRRHIALARKGGGDAAVAALEAVRRELEERILATLQETEDLIDGKAEKA